MVGDVHDDSLDGVARGTSDIGVGLRDNVQNDTIVGIVILMVVTEPIACLDMHFDIACPHDITYLDFGIEEVGTCIEVPESRVYDFEGSVVQGVDGRKQTLLPDVIHQFFHSEKCFAR